MCEIYREKKKRNFEFTDNLQKKKFYRKKKFTDEICKYLYRKTNF